MKKLKTLILIFIAYKLTILLASFLYHQPYVQLIHFEHFATEDIEFNDIYYSTRNKLDTNLINEKEVVLINSGSIPNDANFRKTLAEVLHKISTYQVTGIGVDLIFEKHKDSNDVFLKNQLINNPKIVLAQDIL